LAIEMFSCLADTRVLIEDWRQDYNHHRPHSALRMMAPSRSRSGGAPAHQAAARRRSPYGLASFNAGANPNLALPTNHQLSQRVLRRRGRTL
jgi:hypothetical protein